MSQDPTQRENINVTINVPKPINAEIAVVKSINANIADVGGISANLNPGAISNYNGLTHKPVINGVTLQGELSLDDLNIQEKGKVNYEETLNKPIINDVVLTGKKTATQLKLQDKMDTISNMDIENLLGLD